MTGITYTARTYPRPTPNERLVAEARCLQRRAFMLWVAALCKLGALFFFLAIPGVVEGLRANPMTLLPLVPFVGWTIFYLVHGYNHDYEKAQTHIERNTPQPQSPHYPTI